MKVSFEFDGATPEQVSSVLELFYKTYGEENISSDGEEIIIGKINLYVSLKCKDSGKLIGYYHKDNGKEISWHIKKPSKNNKPRKNQVYEDKELDFVICK